MRINNVQKWMSNLGSMMTPDQVGAGTVPSSFAMSSSSSRTILSRLRGHSGSARHKGTHRPPKKGPSRFEEACRKFVKRFVWDPVTFKEPFFEWVDRVKREDGQEFVQPTSSHFRHDAANPLTQQIVACVAEIAKAGWSREAAPVIVGLGSGGAALEAHIAAATNLPVLAVDLHRPQQLGAGVTYQPANLNSLPFGTGSKRIAVASFSLEYAGPSAFREAYRILQHGGVLIALVHAKGSSLLHRGIIAKLIKFFGSGLYKIAVSLPALRWVTPQGGAWEAMARFVEQMSDCAFNDVEAVRRTMCGARFRDIHIERALSPYIFSPQGASRIFVGYLVRAKK